VWYLLSLHPEEEAKLQAELDAVLSGRVPTHDDLEKLSYPAHRSVTVGRRRPDAAWDRNFRPIRHIF
jgi:hypothetical protein